MAARAVVMRDAVDHAVVAPVEPQEMPSDTTPYKETVQGEMARHGYLLYDADDRQVLEEENPGSTCLR